MGNSSEAMLKQESTSFMEGSSQMVGLALHDIPKNITNNVELSHHQLIQINNLDPTKKMDGWGDWVVCLLDAFNQCIPELTYD